MTSDETERAVGLIGEQVRLLNREQRYGDAVRLLEEAIPRYPDRPDLLEMLGGVLWDMGRREESVKAWQEAIQLGGELGMPALDTEHPTEEAGACGRGHRGPPAGD